MAYQFQVKGGSQKPWKQQLMLALEKQATLSYQRAHPESLKKQAEQDTEAALRRRRFGIAMTIVGAVLAVIGLMDLKEQWVVALVSLRTLPPCCQDSDQAAAKYAGNGPDLHGRAHGV